MADKPYTLHLVIDDHWIEIASFAWRQFQDLGRGAVFVNLDQMELADSGLRLPELEYLLPSDRKVDGLADQFDPDNGRNLVHALIEHYKPEQNLVCIVLEPDGSVDARNGMNPHVSPPEAARMNELG